MQELSCFAPSVTEEENIDFNLGDEEEEPEHPNRRLVIDDSESDIEVMNESIEIDVVESVSS